MFSSAITKANEDELTKVWVYLTKLDAEKTLALRGSHSLIKINGKTVADNTWVLRSDIDEVLSYLDILYDEFELENQQLKEKLDTIHDQLWSVHSNPNREESHLITKNLTQIVEWTEEWKQRLGFLLELGQYSKLIELKTPFKEKNQLQVNQRYGYYIKNKEKRMFEGIKVQTNKDEEIIAPLAGKISVSKEEKEGSNSITIQSNHRQLTIKNLLPTITDGQEIKVGESIGKAAEDELIIKYFKNEKSVNPSFYFQQVNYLETFNPEQDFQNSSFNENSFRQLILLHCHVFSDKADKIMSEAKRNGISPVIFAAIMIYESAWGTSKGIVEKNNPAGLMSDQGLITYNSLDEGIEATGRTLKNLIIERKLTTVEKLGEFYCPIGAENDPSGLNKYWVPAIKQIMVQLGGSSEMGLLWESPSILYEQILTNAQSIYQKGVQYSQASNRGAFPYHDCSSFVIWAMNEAGINVPLGNTETLYGLEGRILQPISRSEVRAGDLFIWGHKGSSSGNYGHTGFFLDSGGKNILHCTPATEKGFGQNGDVVITPFEGYYGDPQLAPVYFYRIIGGNEA